MTSIWTLGFNPEDLADQLYKHFGPGTEYAAARQQAEEKKFGKQTDFTSKSLSAVQGPWTNHCVKTFLALREAGVKPPTDGYSVDPDGIVKSIAVVALLSGKPETYLGMWLICNKLECHTQVNYIYVNFKSIFKATW